MMLMKDLKKKISKNLLTMLAMNVTSDTPHKKSLETLKNKALLNETEELQINETSYNRHTAK